MVGPGIRSAGPLRSEGPVSTTSPAKKYEINVNRNHKRDVFGSSSCRRPRRIYIWDHASGATPRLFPRFLSLFDVKQRERLLIRFGHNTCVTDGIYVGFDRKTRSFSGPLVCPKYTPIYVHKNKQLLAVICRITHQKVDTRTIRIRYIQYKQKHMLYFVKIIYHEYHVDLKTFQTYTKKK